ncbi:uncharacterized protein LOC123542898 [Mercenaria mercenaria]|uniref:uncharacterized protein LOC123542898 n=1 Tax=Mercenaria mercenaria TaxID=6596 RepID=UPI00234F658D|nr:uncharacterized protein LOC123542898 [Mercenaria mercenaria]
MEFNMMFAVCVAVLAGIDAGYVDTCASTPTQNCSLFSYKSDLVSAQDLRNQNMTSGGWTMIYGSEFALKQSYGKCNYKWIPMESDNVIKRQHICYNNDLKRCESFDAFVTWVDDECGRVKEIEVNNTMTGTFFSQDVQQYLLYYMCFNQTSAGACAVRYLDIIVKDYRYKDSLDKELDLKGMPWHLLSADLKNNFGFEFSSQEINFHWKGPECNFDGTIVTDDVSRPRIAYYMLHIMLILTYSF